MSDRRVSKELPLVLQAPDDEFVSLLAVRALELRRLLCEAGLSVERVHEREPVTATDPVVILTIGGRHLDDTGAV